MPEEKEPTGFKVVDRRSFASDGTPYDRPQDDERRDERKSERAGAASAAKSQARREAAPEPSFVGTDQAFEGLLTELYNLAVLQMGLVTGPSGEAVPPDLEGAHRTIDLIEALERKTRGNLSARESRLLEQILYELRLSFVEINKRFAHQPK